MLQLVWMYRSRRIHGEPLASSYIHISVAFFAIGTKRPEIETKNQNEQNTFFPKVHDYGFPHLEWETMIPSNKRIVAYL